MERDKLARFEQTILTHLNAAYNLARWMTRNEHDAEDVVQDAYLRAFRSFDCFEAGRDGRAWLLAIVRNTCYTWLRRNRPQEIVAVFDEQIHGGAAPAQDFEQFVIQKDRAELFRRALAELPLEFREALILREVEGLSYKEISRIADVPIGTVMSRLARGRKQVQQRLLRMAGDQETSK